MTDVQAPMSRPSASKQKVSLDGFLSCGGKIEGKEDPPEEETPTSILLGVCGDVNIDALLTAAKKDKLPMTPAKRSKPRSLKQKGELSQSAHVNTVSPKPKGNEGRRSSDGKAKRSPLGRSHSFGKPQDSAVTARRSSDKGKKKAGVSRSKSFGGDSAPLKRIPRNAPRGVHPKPTREKPTRAQSMGEKQSSQRKLGEKQSSQRKLGEKQSPRRKLGETTGSLRNVRGGSSTDKEKSTKRRSRSGRRESKRPTTPTPDEDGAALERQNTDQTALSAPSAFPVNFPQEDPLGDAAFEATFGEPADSEEEKLPPPKDDEEFESDEEDECKQDAGIMQFDPTATDNVVLVRQDSGEAAFPSCPVELDISLPNHDLDDSGQDTCKTPRATTPEPQHTVDDDGKATSRWGKSGFGFFQTKMKKSNSFKLSNKSEDQDAENKSTSMFGLFSGSHHGGHQQLGDDDTIDFSGRH